ncbi:MAG: glycosyltransferase [Erysipelotrichaceae bacterium]|nr:glycosyltransferase [Erysipelotrichaceae bacterium]
MNKPFISIIVPVYNAEKHLRRCIDSILEQSFRDFEVILVDDGSADGSPSILDEYRDSDERVKVIHKENEGVSKARNTALDIAVGKWIQFADADDWLSNNAMASFVDTADKHDCEMVVADFYRVVNERFSKKGSIKKDGLLSKLEYADEMMDNPADFYYGVLWNKFYRKDIIDEYHLRMNDDVSWCEDFLFNLEYIYHIDSIYILKTPVYYYFKNRDSIVNNLSIGKVINSKINIYNYYQLFLSSVFDKEEYNQMIFRISRFLIDSADDSRVTPLEAKLGEEKISISSEYTEDENLFSDLYLERKYLEHVLKETAVRYDLKEDELMVLYIIDKYDGEITLKEISDISGTSQLIIYGQIQSLLSDEYLSIVSTDVYRILDKGEDVLSLLNDNLKKAEDNLYEGISEEERDIFKKLYKKILRNIIMKTGR